MNYTIQSINDTNKMNNTSEIMTMDIKSLLNSYENTKIFEIVMNIILVKYGGRYATLIENNGFSKTEQEKYSKILDTIITDFDLYKTPDIVSYRYYVTETQINTPTNHPEIAVLLGYYCKDHDFSNTSLKRVSLDILEVQTNSQIYVEVGEYSKVDIKKLTEFGNNKCKLWNSIMKKLSLPYSFTTSIEIIEPIETYMSRYKDIEYVREHLVEYAIILYNNFVNTSVFVDKKELIIEYFDIFVFIMDKINEKIIDKLFDKYRYPSNGFDNLETNLQLFEDTIIKIKKGNTNLTRTQMEIEFDKFLKKYK